MWQSLFRIASCLGLIWTLIGTTPAVAQQWAQSMFSETEHDFGKVANGSKTHFTFEFKNKYKETVHVSSIRSSCGCTTPTVLKDTLKTGETSGILATFNTSSFSGAKSATVTVVFDRPFFAEVKLQVSGVILSDVFFDPAEIAFGELAAGNEVEREVKVSFAGRPNLRIEDVRSVCSDLRVRLGEAVLKPGRVEYVMKVGLKSTVSEGDLSERLTLVTNEPSLKSVVVSVTGRIRPPLEVKPESIHFGKPAEMAVVSERFFLRAEKPFTVNDIQCSDPRVTFEYAKDAKVGHLVKVVFKNDGSASGPFKLTANVITDLPNNASAICTLTGEVAAPPAVTDQASIPSDNASEAKAP